MREDIDQNTFIYYSNGRISGRVVEYHVHKGQGYLERAGYSYFFRVSRSSVNLKYAIKARIRRDSQITLRFWPVVAFPELLNDSVHLKVHHFSEHQDLNNVKIQGIVGESDAGKCMIQIPSFQRNKTYYSCVICDELLDLGSHVKVEGLLHQGIILAETITNMSLPETRSAG